MDSQAALGAEAGALGAGQNRIGCCMMKGSPTPPCRMTQPQPLQRHFFARPDFLEDVPELQPESVLLSDGPGIGSEDPEPAPSNTFPTTDVY
jgi:hypothetical protein